jgi:hypothetical protein
MAWCGQQGPITVELVNDKRIIDCVHASHLVLGSKDVRLKRQAVYISPYATECLCHSHPARSGRARQAAKNPSNYLFLSDWIPQRSEYH